MICNMISYMISCMISYTLCKKLWYHRQYWFVQYHMIFNIISYIYDIIYTSMISYSVGAHAISYDNRVWYHSTFHMIRGSISCYKIMHDIINWHAMMQVMISYVSLHSYCLSSPRSSGLVQSWHKLHSSTASSRINLKCNKSRYFGVVCRLKSTREGCYRRYFSTALA